jgi:hypothetical protein
MALDPVGMPGSSVGERPPDEMPFGVSPQPNLEMGNVGTPHIQSRKEDGRHKGIVGKSRRAF